MSRDDKFFASDDDMEVKKAATPALDNLPYTREILMAKIFDEIAGEELEEFRSAKARPGQAELQGAADAGLAKLKSAVWYSILQAKKAVGHLPAKPTREQAISAAREAADALGEALIAALPAPLTAIRDAGAEVGLSLLPKRRAAKKPSATDVFTTQIEFDPDNPDAADWALEHTGELIKGITETTRQDIAEAIADSFSEDGDPEEAYDAILAAIGDETRATLIARTESLRAANEGQRQGWDQAVEKGLLDENSKRTWIATEGCCDDCDALDGETTELDGEYPDPGGDGPPLHPNCRCTEGIVG